MFGIVNFETFLIAGILLNLMPGADTLYVLGRSISNGKNEGFLSALGISTGSIIHTLLAGFGLSILLAESQFAFNIVKYLGAIYLIYLGTKSFVSSNKKNQNLVLKSYTTKNSRIYFSGVLTNVLNPKVALFYLAFLPQFIDHNYNLHFISFIILGLSFTITGTLWCFVLVLFSVTFSKRLNDNSKIKSSLDKIVGIVFISIGIKLALSKLKNI